MDPAWAHPRTHVRREAHWAHGVRTQAGPPATHRQVQELLGLVQEAGHEDFRDARRPLGFTQRQAGGKFTRDEAEAWIAQLQDGPDDGDGDRTAAAAAAGTAPDGRRADSAHDAGRAPRRRAATSRLGRHGAVTPYRGVAQVPQRDWPKR